jgi:hypothetical protein
MGSAIPHEGEAKGSLASPSAFEEGPAFWLLSARQLLRLVAPGIPIFAADVQSGFSRIGSAALSAQFGFKYGNAGLKLMHHMGRGGRRMGDRLGAPSGRPLGKRISLDPPLIVVIAARNQLFLFYGPHYRAA